MILETTDLSEFNFLYYNLDSILFPLLQTSDKQQFLSEKEDDIINRLGSKQILIIAHVWESLDPALWKRDIEDLVGKIKDKKPELKIIQIANSWYTEQNANLTTADLTYYLDFFLLRVFYCVLVKNLSCPSTKWNNNSKQFLFLTGKPYKINRVKLLYELIKNGLENQMVWSFQCQTQFEMAASAKCLGVLTDNEFNEFVNRYKKLPDKYFSLTGIPFDTELYKDKLFDLVSETEFHRPWSAPWITEKVWLAIVNRLPFIVAGEIKTLSKLNKMGFKTFDDFLLIPNYDNPDSDRYLHYRDDYSSKGFIQTYKNKKEWKDFYCSFKGPDWPEFVPLEDINKLPIEFQNEIASAYCQGIQADSELRIDAIIQNANFWLTNINQYHDQICHDIEINYNKFVELGQKNFKLVQEWQEQNYLRGNLLEQMIWEYV